MNYLMDAYHVSLAAMKRNINSHTGARWWRWLYDLNGWCFHSSIYYDTNLCCLHERFILFWCLGWKIIKGQQSCWNCYAVLQKIIERLLNLVQFHCLTEYWLTLHHLQCVTLCHHNEQRRRKAWFDTNR